MLSILDQYATEKIPLGTARNLILNAFPMDGDAVDALLEVIEPENAAEPILPDENLNGPLDPEEDAGAPDDTEEEALCTCGMYEFTDAIVVKIIYNHREDI